VLTYDQIEPIARRVSKDSLGLVLHHPEAWAKTTCCFENVWRKVRTAGGRVVYGWTFTSRVNVEHGPYIFLMHHAVWHAPDKRLIDVTPFHEDPAHRPLSIEGLVCFLVDESALPVEDGVAIGPRPNRYFALDENNAGLLDYVRKLNEDEQIELRSIYSNLNRQGDEI